MKFHEYAEIFPLHGGDQLDELAQDLAAVGQQEPIVTYQGKVLDGRRLFLACELAKVKPWFEEYKGEDALGYVISKNLHRRHLDGAERSLVAARIVNVRRGKPAGSNGYSETTKVVPVQPAQAARIMNVTTKSVERATKVLATPAVAAAVQAGKLSISAGATIADLPPEDQAAALAGQGGKKKTFRDELVEQALELADRLDNEIRTSHEATVELRLVDQMVTLLETMRAGRKPPVAILWDDDMSFRPSAPNDGDGAATFRDEPKKRRKISA